MTERALDTGLPVAFVPGNHDYLSPLNAGAVERFTRWWRDTGRRQGGQHCHDAASLKRHLVHLFSSG